MKRVLKPFPKYFEEVEGIKLGEDRIDYLMINLPPFCNYKCKKCFTRSSSRKIENPLSLSEIKNIIDQGRDFGAKAVGLTGEGEPLVIRNTRDIVEHSNKKGMIPLIATNGSLLSEDNAKFLHDNNVSITVSIDTLNEKTYDKICGIEGKFRDVMENVEYARKLFGDSIETKNGYRVMRLGIHSIISAENVDDATRIRDFCGDDIFFSSDYVANVGGALEHPETRGTDEQYSKLKEAARLASEPIVMSKGPGGKKICGLFYHGLAVGGGGEILIDAHAIDSENLIGNIRRQGMGELLDQVDTLKKTFYDKFSSYCPIRDSNYNKFLSYLKSSGNP